jgi:hypothetical protein
VDWKKTNKTKIQKIKDLPRCQGGFVFSLATIDKGKRRRNVGSSQKRKLKIKLVNADSLKKKRMA